MINKNFGNFLATLKWIFQILTHELYNLILMEFNTNGILQCILQNEIFKHTICNAYFTPMQPNAYFHILFRVFCIFSPLMATA